MAQLKVMFLGGTLDHTIRLVDADPVRPERPNPLLISAPIYSFTRPRAGGPSAVETALQDYDLQRVESGDRHWWCFVLRGHAPPRRHLIDANPNPI